MCAIALSLAYPVREYIAQHRQIDQLEAQHKMAEAQVRRLEAEQQRLNDPAYIEDQARARLNMCLPAETCYVIINGRTGSGLPQPPGRSGPGLVRDLVEVRPAGGPAGAAVTVAADVTPR